MASLNEVMASAPSDDLEGEESREQKQPIPHILVLLGNNAQAMAEHLSSLTRHFDMCVTAVRSTEGGSALARRRAAEISTSQLSDPVSISGVIADPTDLEPMSAEERAEVISVVLQDAPEVDEVVAELQSAAEGMEGEFTSLTERVEAVKAAHEATVQAFHVLKDLGLRLNSYVAAEGEFLERWTGELSAVQEKLAEMDELRRFYDGYAAAYDSLILEADRRRLVEEKVRSVWRKAREVVDRIVEADQREREAFMEEIGEWLPTDLWVGMEKGLRRWEVRALDEIGGSVGGKDGEDELGSATLQHRAPALSRSVVNAAMQRLSQAGEPG
jgi:autophagy-related protein 17